MERVKVGEDLLALVVCDTDALAAELQVVGQYFKKPGWISGEGKLEAQNKACEAEVVEQGGMLEEFKVKSEMAGVKGTFVISMGWKGSRRAWREKVCRKMGCCDMLPRNRWWIWYSLP